MTIFLLTFILYANLNFLKNVVNANVMFDSRMIVLNVVLDEPTFTYIMMGLLLFVTVIVIIFAGYSIYKSYIPRNVVGLQRQIRKLESKVNWSLTGALIGALIMMAFIGIGYSHPMYWRTFCPKT